MSRRVTLLREPGVKCFSMVSGDVFITSQFVAQPEDAERLAACWNACEDVPTSLLAVGLLKAREESLEGARESRSKAHDRADELACKVLALQAQLGRVEGALLRYMDCDQSMDVEGDTPHAQAVKAMEVQS